MLYPILSKAYCYKETKEKTVLQCVFKPFLEQTTLMMYLSTTIIGKNEITDPKQWQKKIHIKIL